MTIAQLPSPGAPLKTTRPAGGHGTPRSTKGRFPKDQHDDRKDGSVGDVATPDVFGALLQAMIPGQAAPTSVAKTAAGSVAAKADSNATAGSLLPLNASTNQASAGAATSPGSGPDANATGEAKAGPESGTASPSTLQQPVDRVTPRLSAGNAEPTLATAHHEGRVPDAHQNDHGAPTVEPGGQALIGRPESDGRLKPGLPQMGEGRALTLQGLAHDIPGLTQPGSPAATQIGAQTVSAGGAATAGEHRRVDPTNDRRASAIAGTAGGASSNAPVTSGHLRAQGDPARKDQAKNGERSTTSDTSTPATMSLDVDQATAAGPGGMAGDAARGAPSDHVPTLHVVEQVRSHLLTQSLNQSLSRNGSSTIVIRLDPPSLGKVQVRIEKGEGTRIQVHFRVEDRGARDALVNGWDQLDRALRAEGYSPDNLSVEMNPFPTTANDMGSAGNGGWPTDSGHQSSSQFGNNGASGGGTTPSVEATSATLAHSSYYVDYIL